MMITKYDNPYQTRHQLEKLLQVSPATIYRWIKEGNFPKPLRLGANMVRWKALDIEAWIKDRENNNFKGDSNAN